MSVAEIKFGKINRNVHPLRRIGDRYVEIMAYTDRPHISGTGRTLAYERIIQMTFKEIAAVTTLVALAIPIAQALLN